MDKYRNDGGWQRLAGKAKEQWLEWLRGESGQGDAAATAPPVGSHWALRSTQGPLLEFSGNNESDGSRVARRVD